MTANSKIYCKYFPVLPARWYCQQCQINFSDACTKPHDKFAAPDAEKNCPICRHTLNSLGIGNSVQPFWERIPKFFAYPAKTQSLIYIAVLSLLNLLFVLSPLLGLVILIVSSYAILLYAYKCLNHIARGHMDAPGDLDSYEVVNRFLIYKQIFVYFLLGLAVAFCAGKFGPIAGLIAAALILIGLPASVMLLVISGRVLEAVNPVKILMVVGTIGKSYFILYFFLLLMLGGQELLNNFAIQHVGEMIIVPVSVFIQGYFTVAMYAMMGYIIYQYHEELGFDGVQEVDNELEKVQGLSDDPFINEINILITEGMRDEAITRLQAKIKQHKKQEYYAKLLKLFQSTDRVDELLQHVYHYLQYLLNNENLPEYKIMRELLHVYEASLAAAPHSYFPDAEVVFKIARGAYNNQKYDMVLQTLNSFHKRFPKHALVVDAYFLVARVLVEYKQNDKQADKVLNSLIRQYPNDPLIPEIKEYLGFISKVMA